MLQNTPTGKAKISLTSEYLILTEAFKLIHAETVDRTLPAGQIPAPQGEAQIERYIFATLRIRNILAGGIRQSNPGVTPYSK